MAKLLFAQTAWDRAATDQQKRGELMRGARTRYDHGFRDGSAIVRVFRRSNIGEIDRAKWKWKRSGTRAAKDPVPGAQWKTAPPCHIQSGELCPRERAGAVEVLDAAIFTIKA